MVRFLPLCLVVGQRLQPEERIYVRADEQDGHTGLAGLG